ncbi:double-stranded RNA-binding protein Staufen homolog 2 [Malaya genurostris]|uniref:double-stranded RNA-binding protein Staufen homolog 2 n=1 Tax=Malaya genurostris TaxID=325434 RepID=UPI0026F39752|nr:double-stranded RNA-binding protein Staufen homolog 2 [Malaya genurostris]
MIHGHPPQPQQPAQHHMTHPPLQAPPPHLPHLTSVPPPNVPPQGTLQQPPREHPGPRINNRHHHHHHHHTGLPAGAAIPTIPTGGPQMPIQPYGTRKPSSQHFGNSGGVSMKPMGYPPKSLPYSSSNSNNNNNNNSTSTNSGSHHHQNSHHQQQHHQQQHNSHHNNNHHHTHHNHQSGAIPVVSAAGPGGSKPRMIPAHEPKIIHNHNSNAAPQTNTSNVIVVHQTDPVQLSGGMSSTAATTPTGKSIKNNNNNSITSSAGTGSITNVGSSGGGGGIGSGGCGSASNTGASGTSLSTNAGSASDGQNDSTSQSQLQQPNQLLSSVPETLANTKEKTPMCLVNELARYNKIQHQYRLTGETGPAHKKRFTVTLKLGDEEYTAEGPSIKKAQHSAAHEAIGATKYKHPPAKINRTKTGGKTNIGNITPTVELNALAMKRGEPTVYETEMVDAPVVPKYNANSHPPPVAPQQSVGGGGGGGGGGGPHYFPVPPPGSYGAYHRNNTMYSNPPPGGMRYGAPPPCSYNRRNPMGNKSDYPRGYYYNHHMPPIPQHVPEVYKVTLHVGERTFLGEGHTLQAARHDAAARALEVLKPLTPDTANALSECHDTSIDSDDPNSELKSPISLVHEMALKRKLTVQFEVHGEKGPPHMKVFTTLCKVGNIVTEGEGNGKKLSKKRAAEKMLDELRKIAPASPEKNTRTMLKQKRKVPLPKKKTRNLIKDNADEDPSDMVNPISRLMQIQQARKEKEPVYTLLEERGVARRREFVMEVAASGSVATGVGPTKKLAKKEAAENLLVSLGYGRSTVANSSTLNKENNSASANEMGEKPNRKVMFNDGLSVQSNGKQGGSTGRQIVPGVLQLNSGISNNKSNPPAKDYAHENNTQDNTNTSTATVVDNSMKSGQANSVGATNTTSSATTATTTSTTPAVSSSNPDVGRMKEQLMYLAQLLKFDVMFSDFPKGNHGEYLTLVTLSTEPPQLCHGSGASLEESHDEAARGALEILSKIGLDNVKPKGSSAAAASDESKSKSPLSNGLKK